MDTQIQIELSKEAGNINRPNYVNSSWEIEYKHHLGMVENPFPFERFRLKFLMLNRMFDNDPEGKNESYDKPIQTLCNELGY